MDCKKFFWNIIGILILLLVCGSGVAWAADTALVDMTEDTSLGMDSVFYTVDDPAGTPADRKATIQELADTVLGDMVDGDVPASITRDSEAAAAYQPLEATLTDIADGTVTENLDFSANPMADNEIADAHSHAADSIDAITEIAAALKSGSDGTLMTGTAGTNGNCVEFNADGDLVDSGGACGGGNTAYDDIGDPDASGSISFGTYTATYTGASTAADQYNFTGTGAIGDVSVFKIEHNTGNATNGTLLELVQTDTDIDPLSIVVNSSEVFKVDSAGAVTATSFGTGGSADPALTLEDTDDAAGTGKFYANSSGGANDVVLYLGVEDSGGEDQTYIELDGVTERVEIQKDLDVEGVIYIPEQADANADRAGYGQIWVNTATPNELWFTDDAGTDFQLGLSASGDNVSVDSGATTDPDFVSTGDIDFVNTSNTITANLNADVVAAAEMADADHGMGSWSGGSLTIEDFALNADADAGDYDITSIDQLQGLDTGLFIDMGADGILQMSSDGTYHFDIDSETLIMDSGTNQIAFSTDTGVTEIDFGSFQVVTTGDIMGGINISSKTAATYTTGTDDAHEEYGTLFINGDNDAIDFTLGTAVAGKSMCFMQGQGVSGAITVQPATGDYLVVDGVRGTIATDYDSSGAGGDKICVVAMDATDWTVTSESGTWSE